MEQQIGRYQLLEEIASGGQGAVYRAFDPETGQIVALKVLHAHLGDDVHLERFHREARMAASINHPNVIRVSDVGQDGDSDFIAMELLPDSLARVIESGGALPVDRAVDFASQIADGLAAAHALGIVHRDIKPQNVLIGPDGNVKVSDFGIARATAFSTMTVTGAMMGTPHYMSPEQARGHREDIRSDLYSLGVLLYQMLTGEVPFDAETPLEVLEMHRETTPPKVRQERSEVPRPLEAVVARCLEKDPGRRYQAPEELAHALKEAVPEAVRLRPQPIAEPPRFAAAIPAEESVDADASTRWGLWRWLGVPVWLRAGAGIAVVALFIGVGTYFLVSKSTLGQAPTEIGVMVDPTLPAQVVVMAHDGGSFGVHIPAGIVERPHTLTVRPLTDRETGETAPPLDNGIIVSRAFEVELFSEDGGVAENLKLESPVTITADYTAQDLAQAESDANRLTIVWFDELARQWDALPTRVDSLERTLTAEVDHLSMFDSLVKSLCRST